MLTDVVFVFSYSCDYITNLPPNSPPMKTGVQSPCVRVSCYYKQTAHPVRLASLVIYSLLLFFFFFLSLFNSNVNFFNSPKYLFLYYTYVAPHSRVFQNCQKVAEGNLS